MRTTRTDLRAAALSTILAGTVLLSACGGSSSDAEPAASASTPAPASTDNSPPPPDRWAALLDQIGPDGEVSTQLALDAFSLGVAPLPGSELRKADADEPILDATDAVAWVLRDYDQLSAEQQAAVGEALSSPDVPASSGLIRQASTHGCYGQTVATADSPGAEEIRGEADGLIAEIEAQLGGAIELVAPVYIVLDHRDAGLGLAYTWADPGDCNNTSMATCTIHLSDDAEAMRGADRRMVLAHELFHCFQFQYLGVTAYEMPAWILEGLPAWVGEDMSGGTKTSTKWWTPYLTNPGKSLYQRDYDAIGFYAHMDEVGIDPWTRATAIFDGFSNEPAFEGAGASSGAFLESWPSSHLRRTELGSAWDATGPGITIDRAEPQPLQVGVGVTTRDIGKVSGSLFDVSFGADLVTIEVFGTARLATDGTDAVVQSGTTWCARAGGCVCPDGSSPGSFERIDGDVIVAVTGGTQTATLTFTGSPLDCDEKEPLVDPCLVGTWVSTTAYIDDTVTNAPVDELGGGAGIVLTIASSGQFTMNFDSSTPTSTDLGDGLVLSARTRGVAHGALTAEGGTITLVSNDYATTLVTQMSTGGSIPGGSGLGSGTYSCRAGGFDARTPFELGQGVFAFTSA